MASKEKSNPIHATHEFGPFVRPDSEILILGSFPSVKSRLQGFYYGHPQNRFWNVLSAICGVSFQNDVENKKKILADIHIALYDVIDSCDIIGSSDASIKNPVFTDVSALIRGTKIKRIVLNGKKAMTLFEKHTHIGLPSDIVVVDAPSTSPANAAVSIEQLISEWTKALGR